MLLKSSPSHRQPSIKVKLFALTLTLAVLGAALSPQLAKAAGLDALSSTLSQTISNVTGRVLTPIQQAEGSVNSAIGKTEGAIGNLFSGANGAIGSLVAPFEQQLASYLQAFQNFFQHSIANLLGGIFSGNGTSSATGNNSRNTNGDVVVPTETTGVLGIPDFEAAHKALTQQTLASSQQGFSGGSLQLSDQFNLNPITLSQSLDFEHDRVESRGMAASVLNTDGQAAMKQEVETTAQALQDIQDKTQAAQGMDVTQDVMKNLTTIANDQSQIASGNYVQLMAMRLQGAANSLVESNISEAADESNRTHHAETMAGAYGVLSGAANVYLPGSGKN